MGRRRHFEAEEFAKEVKLPTDQAKSAVQRELEAEEALEAAKEAQAKKQAETGEEPEPEAAAGSLEAKEEGAIEPTAEDLAPSGRRLKQKSRPGLRRNLARLADTRRECIRRSYQHGRGGC